MLFYFLFFLLLNQNLSPKTCCHCHSSTCPIVNPRVAMQHHHLPCNAFICCIPTVTMGLLDKLRRKKDETVEKVKEQTTPQPTNPTNAPPPPGRRIKRYTSEGKPVYE